MGRGNSVWTGRKGILYFYQAGGGQPFHWTFLVYSDDIKQPLGLPISKLSDPFVQGVLSREDMKGGRFQTGNGLFDREFLVSQTFFSKRSRELFLDRVTSKFQEKLLHLNTRFYFDTLGVGHLEHSRKFSVDFRGRSIIERYSVLLGIITIRIHDLAPLKQVLDDCVGLYEEFKINFAE